jgi:uncharacterized repeat protein (TIGR01451 family)
MTGINMRASALSLLPALLLAGCGSDSNSGGSGASAQAAVSAVQTVDKTAANVGDSVTWTVTATNNGAGATTGVVTLISTLPSNVSGISVVPTGATCGPAVGTLTCTIPAGLAPGGVATVQISAKASAVGSLTSTVSATGASASGCATKADCSSTTTIGAAPNVTVTASVSKASAVVGDTLSWTITAANSGGATGAPITLTDTLPASGIGATTVTATGATCNPVTGNTLTCTVPAGLTASAAATVVVSAAANATGSLVNTVVAGAGATCGTCSTTTTVAAAGSAYVPASGETAAYADTRLQITFDAAPTLGSTGTIKVYKSADNTLVDTIDISGTPVTANGETQTYMPAANTEIDKLGNNVNLLTQWRYLYYTPVTISSNTATIRLHDGVLGYGTGYYVTVDNGVFTGKVKGTTFAGITSPTTWAFTTKAAPTSPTSVVVNASGTGDFRTVQGALDWIMANGCNTTCTYKTDAKTVTIKNGSYNEQLFLRNVNNLTIQGESRAGVTVYYDNSESYNPGSGGSKTAQPSGSASLTNEVSGTRLSLGGGRSVFLVEGGDMLKLTNFTLQNTHVKSAAFNNQAETIYYNSATTTGSRMVASYMNFISAQDTIQTKGWVWYYQSYIAGDVDFIWGGAFAALFEQCELHTVADPVTPTSGGYVFQSRVTGSTPGFVVLNSTLTADAAVPAGSTFLGRSGGSASYYDDVAYINTKMGPHVQSIGWSTTTTTPSNPLPNPATPTTSAGWRESGSMDSAGNPLSVTGRNSTNASSTLDLSGLNSNTKVFAGWNSNAGWVPTP